MTGRNSTVDKGLSGGRFGKHQWWCLLKRENMKTAYDLLLGAPDAQVTRCQIAYRAIADGDWRQATHHLQNAAQEENGTAWAKEAQELADACQRRNPYRLEATNPVAAEYWGADLD
ncbi:hypothetical protein L1889_18135 [Paenalcaligenes niemegkensis]|uniref:hypothetical protein n=1 Tax=Paenalcaligenes niemegkensis TaxID=2895469 RepID=UPI001EE7846A|nr:hypothetical protein [Paenalcaligenes niemegkensis]MCQ9618359.1 hypothetical protein [Paenalcaligenes niemegkensis]